MSDVLRGNIFLCDFDVYNNDKIKNTQKASRPAIVVSNDLCNRYSPTITLIPITSQVKQNLPTHVVVGIENGLLRQSIALVECITTLDKSILSKQVGHCSDYTMREIDRAIQIQNGIINPFDISKARRLATYIQSLDKRININQNKDDIEFRNGCLFELKEYCDSFGKNYKLFYNINNDYKTIIKKNVGYGSVAM